MKFEKAAKSYESALKKATAKVSKKFSIIFHNRVHQLIKYLEPEFKIKSLAMGMGAWAFSCEPFAIEYDDGSTGLAEDPNDRGALYHPCFNNLLEHPFNYCWRPADAQEKHWEIFDELREILDYIVYDDYLELLEFDNRKIKNET